MGNKINTYGSILDQVIGTKLNKFLAPQQNRGLLDFVRSPYGRDIASGLLAQSGYSTMPTTLGQSLGVAMNQANQLRSQRRANDLSELATLTNLKQLFQNPKQKSRDIRIAEYVGRGIPRDEASDIVDGILEINLNEEGITTVYNPITKETKKYGKILTKDSSDQKSGSSYISPEDLDPKTVEKEKGTVNTIEKIIPRLDNIMSRADNIFGTGNKFKDIGASVAGITPNFIDQYLIDPKVVTAKKDYKQIKKDLQIAMINSQRFPVFEQQQILDMLPDETSFFQDPQAGAIAIKSIKDRLQNKLDESISVLEGETVTTDIMQGSGVQIDPFFPKTESDLMKIKSGQYFVYENKIRIMK